MMKVYIYTLKHPTSLEVRYVGLTRFPTKRLHNEVNYPHSKHLRNWVNSLKEQGLKPVMDIVEESEEGAACEAERKWISDYKSRGCRLINFTNGGERGYVCSEEYRAALSAARKGKKRGPMSEAHREKISAALKGRILSPRDPDYIPWNRGKKLAPMTEEAKAHLREIMKVNFTAEWKEKLRQGSINRKRDSKCTDEQKSQIKRLLAEGYSTRVIAEKYGVSLSTVSDVRLGRIWVKVEPSSVDFPRPQYKTVAMERKKEGVCGTSANYTRGCRCDQCRIAHNLANTEWKRQKRRELTENFGQPSCDSYVWAELVG